MYNIKYKSFSQKAFGHCKRFKRHFVRLFNDIFIIAPLWYRSAGPKVRWSFSRNPFLFLSLLSKWKKLQTHSRKNPTDLSFPPKSSHWKN